MTDAPDVALQDNTNQRLPCLLVLDASGSMSEGGAIQELNAGIRMLEDELKNHEVAGQRVQLLVIKFGGDVEVLSDWTDAMDFAAPALQASGGTPMGAAVRLALAKLEEQKARYKKHGTPYNRPWMFLITDGGPTDEWQQAAVDCRQAEQGKHLTCFTIGVGKNVDLTKLSEFSLSPPKQMDGLKFRELFQWLSNSVAIAAQTAPGATVQMPSPDHWSHTTT
jgi:uncharacterized protein YegL